jgi:hypothetical protein
MPDLAGFGEIAPYLTHPLVLAGFGLLLSFGLLRAVMAKVILSALGQTLRALRP